jgi:hypothetical protein
METGCQTKTRQITLKDKCVVSTCKGKTAPEYSEQQTNDTLRYLEGLFNVKKYLHENKMDRKLEHPDKDKYTQLQRQVSTVLDRSKYNKVDLHTIFSFMRS